MKKEQKIKIFTVVTLIISMLLIIVSITYALYSKLLTGNTTNLINTGTLYFSYDEANFIENGVKIEDAYPISDNIGKLQTGSKQYFDFSVNGKTTIGDIKYEIVAVKQNNSTLDDKYVKVYLTRFNGNAEVASDLVMNNGVVRKFADLQSSTKQNGKIIYIGKIEDGNKNYQQKFRLKMWMSDDVNETDDVFGKTFSIKVNVLGVQ